MKGGKVAKHVPLLFLLVTNPGALQEQLGNLKPFILFFSIVGAVGQSLIVGEGSMEGPMLPTWLRKR